MQNFSAYFVWEYEVGMVMLSVMHLTRTRSTPFRIPGKHTELWGEGTRLLRHGWIGLFWNGLVLLSSWPTQALPHGNGGVVRTPAPTTAFLVLLVHSKVLCVRTPPICCAFLAAYPVLVEPTLCAEHDELPWAALCGVRRTNTEEHEHDLVHHLP